MLGFEVKVFGAASIVQAAAHLDLAALQVALSPFHVCGWMRSKWATVAETLKCRARRLAPS
jgi:hypothetical protein